MRELSIDAAGSGTPLPKFWQALGCDHLYQDTRSGAAEHLFERIGETGAIRYLRNHHALSDEMADFAPLGEGEMLYHFAEGPEPAGPAEEVRVRLDGHGALRPDEASWCLLDREHGNTFRAWEAMGRPARLTPEQLAELRSLERPRRLPGSIGVEAGGGRRCLTLRLPAQSVSLLEIPAAA